MSRSFRSRVGPLLLLVLSLASSGFATEARTFTAKDGRTMEAELLGYKNDTLRVRRVDTGKELKLSLSSLSEADQDTLRTFMRTHPELRDTIAPTDIRVEYSRARFSTEHTKGNQYKEDVILDKWGYSFTVANLTTAEISGVRLEYRIFAEIDPDQLSPKTTREPRLKSKQGSLDITIPASGKTTLQSDTITSRTQKADNDSRWVTHDGLKREIRDQIIHGVWLRVYDGEKIIHETSSPPSLQTKQRWDSSSSVN